MRTLWSERYQPAGINEIAWDGRGEQTGVKDGRYRFIVTANDGFGAVIEKSGPYFELDATPPVVLRGAGESEPYYISPDESSSVGVQDAIGGADPKSLCTVTFNERTIAELDVLDDQGSLRRNLVTDQLVLKAQALAVSWNGRDQNGAVVADGAYRIRVTGKDAYGNASSAYIPVVVDDNAAAEGDGEKSLLAGTEFQVNTSTVGAQTDPSSVALGDGYVVVWTSLDQDGSGNNIYGQRYDGYGTMIGPEFRVNSYTPGSQRRSSVCALDDGFVVIWESDVPEDGVTLVAGQLFDGECRPRGVQFYVSDLAQWSGSVIGSCIAPYKGGFVVTWASLQGWWFLGNSRIGGQLFSTTGAKIGTNFLVCDFGWDSSYGLFDFGVDVARLGDGFMVAWISDPKYRNTKKIHGRTYDEQGLSSGSAFLISETTSGWLGHPKIASVKNDAVIVWNSYDSNGNSEGILGRKYGKDGAALSSEFQVNSSGVAGFPKYDVTQVAEDGFVIAWDSVGQDGDWYGIFGQLFVGSCEKTGGEFQLNSYTANSQTAPALCPVKKGFIAAWTSVGQDGSEGGIFAKRYSVTVDPTQNLAARFLFPVSGETVNSARNFTVSAMATDTYFSKYRVSASGKWNGAAETRTIAESGSEGINGDICVVDVSRFEKNSPYVVLLEAWDKAGNYRSDQCTYVRPYSSDEFIEFFSMRTTFASPSMPAMISYDLKQPATATVELRNTSNAVVKTVPLGLLPAEPGTASVAVDGIADGEYRMIFRATYSGQEYETYTTFTLDTTSPLLSAADIGYAFSTEESVQFTAEIADANPVSFIMELCTEAGTLVSVLRRGNSADELRAVNVYPKTLEEGHYILRLSAQDAAGNEGILSYPFTVDRTGPNLSIVFPAAGAVARGAIQISGESTDPSGNGVCIVYVVRNGNETELYRSSENAFSYSWDSAIAASTAFSCTLKILGTDSLGNQSVLTRDLVVDNEPPVVNASFASAPYASAERNFIAASNSLYLSAVSGDPYSVVSEIFYSVNGGSWTRYATPLTFSETNLYNVKIKATDSTGNESAVKEVAFALDAVAPDYQLSIGEPKYEKGGLVFIPLHNSIRIDASDGTSDIASGISYIRYRLGNGTWESYAGQNIAVDREGPFDLSIRIVDNVGNETLRIENNIVVDIVPPLTTLDSDVGRYEDADRGIIALAGGGVLSLSAVDLGDPAYTSGVRSLSCSWDGPSGEYTGPVGVAEGTVHDLSFFAVDRVGNTEAARTRRVKVDRTPPRVWWEVDKPVYTAGERVYAKGDITFALKGEDDFSGLESIRFSENGGEEVRYEKRFYFFDGTEKSIVFKGKDFIGNTSPVGTLNVVIDNAPPISSLVPSLSIIDIDGLHYADQRYLFVVVSADALSGVASVTLTLDGVPVDKSGFRILNDGRHVIEYSSQDNVGNRESLKRYELITPIPDRTPPVSVLTPSYTAWKTDAMDFYRSDIAFALASEDILGVAESYASGVNRIQFRLDSAAESTYAGTPIRPDGEGLHKIEYYAVDNVGNIEQTKKHFFTIDDTAPRSLLSIDGNAMLVQDGRITMIESQRIVLSAIDLACGLRRIEYRLDAAEEWVPYVGSIGFSEGDHVIEYRSIDNLGNSEVSRKAEFRVVADYNRMSFETRSLLDSMDDDADFACGDQLIAYLEGNRHSRVMVRDLNHGDARAISLSMRERSEIALGDGYIAVREHARGESDIYLYTTGNKRQTGIKVSDSGIARAPVFNGSNLYWIEENAAGSRIVRYDLKTTTSVVFYSANGKIRQFKAAAGVLTALELTGSENIVHAWIGEGLKSFSFPLEAGELVDCSFHGSTLAVEYSEGENRIALYRLDKEKPETMVRVRGRSPSLVRDGLYFIRQEDGYQVLSFLSPYTGVTSGLLLSGSIAEYSVTEDGSVFVKRSYGIPSHRRTLEHLYEYRPDDHGFMNSGWHLDERFQLTYLKMRDTSPLVDSIQFASGNRAFTYNTYCDQEDFIYADKDVVFFTPLLRYRPLQHIQTFDAEKSIDEGNRLSFTALADVDVIIFAEKPHVAEKMRRRGFAEAPDFFDSTEFDFRRLRWLGRYVVMVKRVNAGEVFTLDDVGSERIAPVVFLRTAKP